MGKNILILTLRAGSGHLQAAKAKHHEYKALGHNPIEKRVLFDLVGKTAGTLVSKIWNTCQAQGVSSMLFFFSVCCQVFDVLVFPFFFFKLSRLLYKDNIDEVVDTQPFGTKAFIRSIRFVSWIRGKKISYKKVLTDLPTEKCSHFFKPLRNLSKKDKAFIEILTTSPMLKEEESEIDFWNKHTKLPLEQIIYSEFPLRPSFKSPESTLRPLNLKFQIHSEIGADLISKCLNLSALKYWLEDKTLSLSLHDEILSLITLGTYPPKTALIDYMTGYIEQKAKFCPQRKEVLFILVGPKGTACDHYQEILKTLEKKICPKNLMVVPLSFQDDKALAPLYQNLDFIIAKSGGLTTMELLKAVKNDIFIHDDPQHNSSNVFSFFTSRFDTMPVWERGNAEYLMDRKGAKLINPNHFKSVTDKFFKKGISFAQASGR